MARYELVLYFIRVPEVGDSSPKLDDPTSWETVKPDGLPDTLEAVLELVSSGGGDVISLTPARDGLLLLAKIPVPPEPMSQTSYDIHGALKDSR